MSAETKPEAVTRWRKKPVEVEAERVDRDKLHRLSREFRAAVHHDTCPGAPLYENGQAEPHVHTLEGPLRISDGDWLIKGIRGEFYPCKPDVFAATYEPAGSPVAPADSAPSLDASRVLPAPDVSPREGASPVTGDLREPLGRIFHEQGRLPVNAEREKPFAVGPWEDRTDEQREIDMRGASAVAAAAVAGPEAKLADVRRTVSTFLEHYGHSELPSFKVAIDLANSIRKALEREISSEEESRDAP